MDLNCLYIIVIFSLFNIRGEGTRITVLSATYTAIETDDISQYQCYPDQDHYSLSFGRFAPIPSRTAPELPVSQLHTKHGDSGVQFIVFANTDLWDSGGFGPFYCQATATRQGVEHFTKVPTFFVRSDAKFTPIDEAFTRTVSIGDKGVTIGFESLHGSDLPINLNATNVTYGTILWRKDGVDVIWSQNGSLELNFSNPIQSSDGGIYEIYYNSERETGRGGLFRLIVRDCPSGSWGPPGCFGICDKCYNGGVCDDKSGSCICPNNFRGDNCLEVCRPKGGNRFGRECEYQCKYNNDQASSCSNRMFCLPDPFGCSCDVGAHGLSCNLACENGTFGAGCSQTCHCQGTSCNIYTGDCPNANATDPDCEAGWSGQNCQIPDICDPGYYGPTCTNKCHCLNDVPCDKMTGECPQLQCAAGSKLHNGTNCEECTDDTFGLNCSGKCHCIASACDKVIGCNGQCLTNWFLPNCLIGMSRVTFVKANPYQPSRITCYVTGEPLPSEEYVSLFRHTSDGGFVLSDATKSSAMEDSAERAVIFHVPRLRPVDYRCIIESSTGLNTSASAFVDVINTTYTLPVIRDNLLVLNVESTTVDLQWTPWIEGVDVGDPPFEEYAIFFRTSSCNWTEAITVSRATDTSGVIKHLEPDTDYEFSVSAARPGPGGSGPISSPINATTLCGKPSGRPRQVTAFIVCSNELGITWQPPDETTAECRSGFTHYVIEYKLSMHESWEGAKLNYTSYPLYGLHGLKGNEKYSIRIRAANKDEVGDLSDVIIARTSIMSESDIRQISQQDDAQLQRQAVTDGIKTSSPVQRDATVAVSHDDQCLILWSVILLGISLPANVVFIVIIGLLCMQKKTNKKTANITAPSSEMTMCDMSKRYVKPRVKPPTCLPVPKLEQPHVGDPKPSTCSPRPELEQPRVDDPTYDNLMIDVQSENDKKTKEEEDNDQLEDSTYQNVGSIQPKLKEKFHKFRF